METGLYEWVTGGIGLIESVQRLRTPIFDFYFVLMTFLGNEEFYLLVLPAIYWCVDKRLGRRLLYLLVFSSVLNEILKNTFRLPRPPDALHIVEEVGFGLPSGHATNSVALWGYAVWRTCRNNFWVWIGVAVVILSTTFSRIYLGVHYPLDTLAGLFGGVLTLLFYLWIEAQLAHRFPRMDRRILLGGALALSLLLPFIQPGDPVGYPAEKSISLAALFLGATVGILYEMDNLRFTVEGTLPRRIGRYLIGIGVTLLFWLGLRILFGLIDGPIWLENMLRFVRYTLTGLAVAGLAPLLFVRLGMAVQSAETSMVSHTIGGVK